MRILVLGASGFLGTWTVRALLAEGHEVSTFIRPSTRPWRLEGVIGLHSVPAAESEWSTEIRRLRPEAIVSLDWAGVAAGTRDDDAQWANVDRQREILTAAAASGTRRFVGVGSQAEYGPRLDRIGEDAELRPTTAYGAAKVAALEQLRETADAAGIEWIWARVFSVFGPLDNRGVLLSTISEALLAGRDVSLSSGEQRWSYLFAADAARAMSLLTMAPQARGIYNLGHPEAPPLRETIERFAAQFTSTGTLLFGSQPARGQARLEPDMNRLLSLGWRPTTGMSDALRLTGDWLTGLTVEDIFDAGRTLPSAPVY